MSAFGPVEHSGDERPRLRNESHFAWQGIGMRKTCVQPQVRTQKAKTIWAENAQQIRPGRVQRGLLLRSR